MAAPQPHAAGNRRPRRSPAARHRADAWRSAGRVQETLLAALSTSPLARYHRVLMPLAGRLTAAAQLVPDSNSQASPALTPHVLALDDDPSVRQLVHDYLVENELRVTTVATGAEFDQVMAREAI